MTLRSLLKRNRPVPEPPLCDYCDAVFSGVTRRHQRDCKFMWPYMADGIPILRGADVILPNGALATVSELHSSDPAERRPRICTGTPPGVEPRVAWWDPSELRPGPRTLTRVAADADTPLSMIARLPANIVAEVAPARLAELCGPALLELVLGLAPTANQSTAALIEAVQMLIAA